MEAPTTEQLESIDKAMNQRMGYAWPGNVRELRNFVLRVAELGELGLQQSERELAAKGMTGVRVDLPYHEAKENWLHHFEITYVRRLLAETGGNISEAARRSGVSRVHLSNLIGRLKLR